MISTALPGQSPIATGASLEALVGIPAEDMHLMTDERTGGLVVNMASRFATGVIDIVDINPSLSVAISDFVSPGSPLTTIMDREVIKLNFQLSGGGQFDLGEDRAFRATEMTACICYQPVGMVKQERYQPQERQLAATLMCEIPFLRSLVEDSVDSLPGPLRDVINGVPTGHFNMTVAGSPEMLAAAEALARRNGTSCFRQMEMQARSFELLYQFFRRVQELEEGRNGRQKLSRADCERLESARNFIELHYGLPLTITRIARHAGMSETKLSGTFKERFGCTVMGYLMQTRMERARHLLRDSDLAITQVALEVGYEHSGNFSTAFRRLYGITPRAFKHH
ncbi:MAG: helix-turn-helix transcriptional regulator [Sphingobium sp.]